MAVRWQTQDELDYVARLSAYVNGPQMLAHYLSTAQYRIEWGAVDGAAVMARVRELLRA